MKDWHVGQRVVCLLDLGTETAKFGMNGPFRNRIYTIREIEVRSSPEFPQPTVTLLLNEIVNPICLLTNGAIGEMSFDASCFRPLDETRLDQFRVHLKTVPKRVEERV